MGVYTSTSCGSCGANWDYMAAGRRNPVGPPYVKCRVCNTINKTSSKLYRDMGTFRRIFFWLDLGSANLIFGLGGLGGAIGFAFFAPDVNIYLKILIVIAFGSLGVSQLYNLFTTPKQIRYIEKTFDKNGGFLWSDEQY